MQWLSVVKGGVMAGGAGFLGWQVNRRLDAMEKREAAKLQMRLTLFSKLDRTLEVGVRHLENANPPALLKPQTPVKSPTHRDVEASIFRAD